MNKKIKIIITITPEGKKETKNKHIKITDGPERKRLKTGYWANGLYFS